MKLNFVEVTYDNLESAVRIQNSIFPLEDGRTNYIEGITNEEEDNKRGTKCVGTGVFCTE